jgi:hypothetical protein
MNTPTTTSTATTSARRLFAPFSIDELDELSTDELRTHVGRYARIIAWFEEDAIPNGPTFEDRLTMVGMCSKLKSILFCLKSWVNARDPQAAEDAQAAPVLLAA